MKTHCFDSLLRSVRAVVWTMFAVCLLSSSSGCPVEEGPIQGPLVRLSLTQTDPATVYAILKVTAVDPSGTPKEMIERFVNPPFDRFGVVFPKETRGTASIEVSLYGSEDCPLATGIDQVQLDSDGEFDTAMTLTAVPLCGTGATLTLLVANIAGGQGVVSSSPNGIQCDGSGNGCSLTVKKGTTLALSAAKTAGTFTGWYGGNCTDTSPTCQVQIHQDTVIHASFSGCKGWCKETAPPTGTNPSLLGIGGTAPSNILTVSDAGIVYRWDGAMWNTIQTPTEVRGTTLRAIAAKVAGAVTYVTGDKGTILRYSDGTFARIQGAPNVRLRAIAMGNSATVHAAVVGDSGTALTISSGGSVQTDTIADADLLTICLLPARSPLSFLVGGHNPLGGRRAFTAEWNGKQLISVQMKMLPADPGSVYALHCGDSLAHFASVDSGVLLENAVTGNGMTDVEDKWKTIASVPTGAKTVRAMWSAGDRSVIAVGDEGLILRFNGSTWTKMTSNTTSNLLAVWGLSPSNIYAVGENATILHYSPE
ncbi:MAG: hypothetical protein U0745_08360 [Polyangia bacterium]